ncbi:MAG: class I SAM-dependent methyltransferase [Gammaproteobacteria bacterium]
MEIQKWPKTFSPLTTEQQAINHDFVKHWHEVLASRARYGMIEKFNHGYVVNHAPKEFLTTLEIGAGLGEHLDYEKLTPIQKGNYVALELRENMAEQIKARHPEIITHIGDCQSQIAFPDNHFDRILAIHVLEHLPNLPAAIKEMYRLCNKHDGCFSIVIPCEGGLAYTLARRISAQRIFEKRYKQSYSWFIEREHVNRPNEIFEELKPYFDITHQRYFPLILPFVNCNLCIGLTLRPRR